jgi:thiol:disulfide interchange protein
MFMQQPWMLASFGGLMVIFALGTFGAHVLPPACKWMRVVQNTLGVMLVAALWFVYS